MRNLGLVSCSRWQVWSLGWFLCWWRRSAGSADVLASTVALERGDFNLRILEGGAPEAVKIELRFGYICVGDIVGVGTAGSKGHSF